MSTQYPEHIWNLIARKLSGEAGMEEIAELESLLGQHPQEHYAYEVLQDLWKSKPTIDRQHAENQYKELQVRMQHMGLTMPTDALELPQGYRDNHIPQKKRLSKKTIFGSFLLIVSIASFLWYYQSTDAKAGDKQESLISNEVSTRNGSKSNLLLPDGTKVYLNAGSKLSYDKDFGQAYRTVNLIGEAYFDVVKNSAKPFIIHTRNMDIRVLGTAFNVKCYPEETETETSLVRGSIEITLKDRPEKIVLKQNEKLIIHDNPVSGLTSSASGKAGNAAGPVLTLSHLTVLPADSLVVETSWMQNKLVFRGENFEAVAVKMERWFGVHIRIDESLRQKRFTGVFEKESLSQALRALQLTVPFSFSIEKDSVFIQK